MDEDLRGDPRNTGMGPQQITGPKTRTVDNEVDRNTKVSLYFSR